MKLTFSKMFTIAFAIFAMLTVTAGCGGGGGPVAVEKPVPGQNYASKVKVTVNLKGDGKISRDETETLECYVENKTAESENVTIQVVLDKTNMLLKKASTYELEGDTPTVVSSSSEGKISLGNISVNTFQNLDVEVGVASRNTSPGPVLVTVKALDGEGNELHSEDIYMEIVGAKDTAKTGTVTISANESTTYSFTFTPSGGSAESKSGSLTANQSVTLTLAEGSISSFNCGSISGKDLSKNRTSGNVTDGNDLGLTCTFSNTSTNNASCSYGGNTYQHGSTREGGGCTIITYVCNNGEWLVQNQTASTSAGCGLPNRAPVINSATASPSSGSAPLNVTFSASATDPDGNSLTYSWAFGDQSSGSGSSTTHTYTQSGNFSATLTVTDGNGGTATRGVSVNVSATSPSPNPNPTPNPTTGTGTVEVRSNVNIANTTVTCNGATQGHYRIIGSETGRHLERVANMDARGSVFGYEVSAQAGYCTLGNYPTAGLDSGKSVLSGTLEANGTLPLKLEYTQPSGPGTAQPDNSSNTGGGSTTWDPTVNPDTFAPNS